MQRIAKVACLAGLVGIVGCPAQNSGKKSGDYVDDTDDTAAGSCTAVVSSFEPETGATDFYYHGSIGVLFDADSGDDASSALIEVRDPSGTAVAATIEWDQAKLHATVWPSLAASTAYTVHVEVCDVTSEATLTTSSLGTPLDVATSNLVGRTYVFTLADADITEPAILEQFDDALLTAPLLFGIMAADDTSLTFEGALGYADDLTQVEDQPTWPFPAADFSTAPYFAAAADHINIKYGDVDIPIADFVLTGTFAADAMTIQQGHVTGLADTRHMGPLLALEDTPNAACDFVADLGVYCQECPDGEEVCLHITGENITANYVEGLTVIPVE